MIILILIYFLFSKEFKLKHTGKGTYICETKSGTKRTLSKCSDLGSATEWRIERKPNGQGLISPSNDPFVWDIAEATRVEIKVKHAKPNQRFSLVYVSPDKYAIVSTDRCLTFEDPYHFMRSCDYSSNQLYTIMYNETEANELTETKSLIGISGSSVDQNVVDKLQRMIDDNKEIAKHISFTHDRRSHGHGHGHHGFDGPHRIRHHISRHSPEESYSRTRKKEEGPALLSFLN
ncbi:hypothetical protein NBO_1136g0001 [Nosema bombycis CQ1]|uniref:Ricin B lectin n=1 Tax=Nosema bombycis (strain CQ1 / CVCC 102059) TaxID=578461 RepID=R0M0E7_NOSB1|nr:hypothetical protein NBO_1136g0001 [Nosema bombycis CQ1]WGJ64411.1 ricin B lectin-like protein [Nosema bombycis]|eukprot:EOB11484.1 hypothetical protein NBO_1136g0001 [Nosema bombycis CQ1]